MNVEGNMQRKSNTHAILAVFVMLLLTWSIVISYDRSSHAENENYANKKQFYGCGIYVDKIVHCDPLLNKIESYTMKGTSSLVYTYGGTFIDGKVGKALSLDGNDYITGPDSPSLRLNGAFSISAWIKLYTLNPVSDFSFAIVVDKSEGEGESGTNWYRLLYDASQQKMRFGFSDVGEIKIVFTNKTDWVVGQWYHVIGTYDPNIAVNNMKIFVDGVLDNQATITGNPNAPAGYLRIGALSGDNPEFYWQGGIDELRIYDRALTENEISEIFKSEVPVDISNGLVGYWAFNGNTNDISGNNNNGFAYGTLIVSMAFAPDGRLFFTEKNTGKIKVMKDGMVLETPFVKISDLHVSSEQGMLGLALDPDFEQNHFVYLYYTSEDKETGKPFNRVVRFTDDHNIGTDTLVLLDRIPANDRGYHSGGALAFGHDEKLYITVGDATLSESAQDPSQLTGKVLRINRDGTIPDDNPFPNSPVYSIGHRNMFGIAFDHQNNFGIVTENGPESYDEINKIEKGGNYGWPTQQPGNVPPELADSSIKPLRSYWLPIAPAQAIYYDGDRLRELKGKFLFTAFMSGSLYALQFDKDNEEIILEEVISLDQHPLVSLAQSPDGSIYYGAYSIYRLESVDVIGKKQMLFPVEITGSVDVKELQFYKDEKKMVIDMHPYGNYTSASIKIPRALLDGILPITDEKQGTNFMVDNSSPGYNIVNANLTSDGDSKLVIVGTIALPEVVGTNIPEFLIVILITIAGGLIGVLLLRRKYLSRFNKVP